MSEELRELHLRGALGTIRTEMYQGREHLVVPVIALMEGVIHAVNASHPERVTAQTLVKAAASWNGRPVVLGHPVRNGTQVSANDPLVLEQHGFGTIFNSRVSGTKLLMDAFVDPARVEKLGGAKFLERIKSGDPIEVSVGAYVHTDSVPGVHDGKAYKGTWLQTTGDHLAMLPDGIGACSVKMGCGAHRAAMRVCEDHFELEDLGGPGSGNWGHGGQGHKDAAAAHTAAAEAHKLAAESVTKAAVPITKNVPDSVHDNAYNHSVAAEKATKHAMEGTKATGAKPYSAQAARTYSNMASTKEWRFGATKEQANAHREAAKYHEAAAKDHLAAASWSKNSKLKGASMHEKLKALLSPFLKALDEETDEGVLGDDYSKDEPCAETITYEALRALIEQAKVSLDAGSEHIDALISAEPSAADDAEAEKVEVARLEALIAMCVQLYGTTNGIIKIASNALRPDNSTSSMAYMEARVAAGKRHSKNDQDIVQQTHDNAVKLGAECTAMKAAAGTPCGCGGHSAEGETQMTRKENIDALLALKDAGFTDEHKRGLDILPDNLLVSLHTLAAKTPGDAIIQAKFAADSALAGHAHGLNAKEAAKRKEDDEAAARVASGTTVEMKAAAAGMSVAQYEESEYLKTAPESIRTLVAGEKARKVARKIELVGVLKTAGALTEEQLNAKSLEDLETLALFAKVETPTDFSGRGLAMRGDTSKDVFLNPPDSYALAREARDKANR